MVARTLRFCVALLVAFVATGAVASAFQEGWETTAKPWGAGSEQGVYFNADCWACHGWGPSQTTQIKDDRAGPHGGFTNATDDCDACHTVHEARGSSKLLPSDTLFGVCNTCHDLSFEGSGGLKGGGGVYGAIRARGEVVLARHNVEGYNNTESSPPTGAVSYVATSSVPGGGALPGLLGCDDCHSPHGNTVMAPWAGQRYRMSVETTLKASNKILQDDPNGTPKGTYSTYGADWCAACHTRRHAASVSGVNNHPVDLTEAVYLDPAMAAQGRTWTETATADGTLPARQAGWSREATPGWAPMCQQCHNNYRDVEKAYVVSLGSHMGPSYTDGRMPTDNPRFQLFPHEGTTVSFLVETADDLCLNCHPTAGLP